VTLTFLSPEPVVKVCPACGIAKPLDARHFYRRVGGFQAWCRVCQLKPRVPMPKRPALDHTRHEPAPATPSLPGTRAGAVRLPPGYAELMTSSGRAALASMAARKGSAA
jgi:hypothetical protein